MATQIYVKIPYSLLFQNSASCISPTLNSAIPFQLDRNLSASMLHLCVSPAFSNSMPRCRGTSSMQSFPQSATSYKILLLQEMKGATTGFCKWQPPIKRRGWGQARRCFSLCSSQHRSQWSQFTPFDHSEHRAARGKCKTMLNTNFQVYSHWEAFHAQNLRK